jgi:hypothetical protein
MSRLLFVWVVVAAALARAQVIPEREMEIIQSLYDAGKFAEASRRANESLAVTNFLDNQRTKLHELSGLSLFNLGDMNGAQAEFLRLLRVNPDHILDPFAVPPAAIKVFEDVRHANADTLNLVRQQIALKLDQEKRAAAERAKLRAEEDERARRASLSTITLRTVEKRSMLVNLIPFGAGQFQQDRVGMGALFAISEGLMGALSIASFIAIEMLYTDIRIDFTNALTADGKGRDSITVRGIPAERRPQERVWSGLKYGSGIAFYALWALGIGEAIWHHQGEVVTEKQITASKPTARVRIFSAPGGLGAALTIVF